jgi:dTDP-4-amino-4,6-dideoxygalactose transaminase
VSLGLDPVSVRALLTERTKAVITVHYGGQASNLAELRDMLEPRGITLIEDAAHALGGACYGTPFGSFGSLACLSFHETKNLSCGEGGAIVVNDPSLVEAVEKLREKGTDRSKFFRGQVDKYTWVSPGSSFLLGEVLAAMLAAGLEDWEATQTARHMAWSMYEASLTGFAARTAFTLHPRLEGNLHPAHLFYLLAPDAQARDALLAHCLASDVLAVSHYQPLAESHEGRRANTPYRDECPVSTYVSSRLLRLPLFSSITSAEVDHVVETLEAWAP